MAQMFAYTKPNKLSLLNDQLIAAGVAPTRCEGLGDSIWLTYPDTQAKAPVDAVVAAHDPAVLSASEQAQQQLEADRSDLAGQYATMLTRLDDIITNGASFTANQVRDAVVDLARVCKRILKLIRSARV